jgi:alpha-beta hydrolase superfamily lysophospholipase
VTTLVPGSYWLNLIALNALACGATAGETLRACASAIESLRAGASDQDPALREAWLAAWQHTGRALEMHGDNAAAAVRPQTASAAYWRACAAFLSAEWSLRLLDPRKVVAFEEMRTCFGKLVALDDGQAVALRVPCAGTELEALYFEAGDDAPVVVHLNGTHSCMEWPYLSGTVAALRRRGLSSLLIDHPGSGSARYRAGLWMTARSEDFGHPLLDFLEACGPTRGRRVGLLGVSMGGYHAARIGALDPRVSAVACWGALFRLAPWQIPGEGSGAGMADLAAEAEARRLYAADSREALVNAMRAFTLDCMLEGLRCPLLLVHGAADAQVPVEQVDLVARAAVNAPRVDRLILAEPGLGAMHANLDNLPLAREALADWLAAELAAAPARTGCTPRS